MYPLCQALGRCYTRGVKWQKYATFAFIPDRFSETAEQMIKTARSNLPYMAGVVENIHSFPSQLQMSAFDVFEYHLQKPVEQHLCEADEPYHWIMESLLGIKKLGCSFFERDAGHKQRFIRCWPHIFKWLNALLEFRPIYDEQNNYASVAGESFNICRSVLPDVLNQDEVIEFAVRAWIGFEDSDGGDRYTGRSLVACLMAIPADTANKTRPIHQALCACDITIEDVVNKLVTRINHAACHTLPPNVPRILTLSNMMVFLVQLRGESFIDSTLKPSVGRCFVSTLKYVLDDANRSADHVRGVHSLLLVICGSLSYQTVVYGVAVMNCGILSLLLRLVSCESESKSVSNSDCVSLASEILHQLLQCLVFTEMIPSCREELRKLYSADLQLKARLKASPKRSREIWKAFETVLLEHVILVRLFTFGYAPEYGVCSNVSTISAQNGFDDKVC